MEKYNVEFTVEELEKMTWEDMYFPNEDLLGPKDRTRMKIWLLQERKKTAAKKKEALQAAATATAAQMEISIADLAEASTSSDAAVTMDVAPAATAVVMDVAPAVTAEAFQPATRKRKQKKAKNAKKMAPEEAPLKKKPEVPVQETAIANRFEPLATIPDEPEARKKVPPVVIRSKTNWVALSGEFARLKLGFSKAKSTAEGISVFPVTEADHRGITAFLSGNKVPYHTYQLQDEKSVKIVIRGIPSEVAESDVKEDLMLRGFPVTSVHRMKRGAEKIPMPLVMVILQKTPECKAIFEVKEVLHLRVNVEVPRRKTAVGQCHRCQRFGHSQRCCQADPKCVKCGGEHHSDTCKKTRETPAVCANCGGPHPANYRGCTNYPKASTGSYAGAVKSRPATEG